MKSTQIIWLIVCVVVVFVNAETIRFSQSPDPKEIFATCGFVEQGMNHATFVVDIPTAEIISEFVDGVRYKRVSVRGFAHMEEVGKPNLPANNYHIAVPLNSKPKVTIIEEESIIIDDILVYPALKPHVDSEEFPFDVEPEFEKDNAIYKANSFFPLSPLNVTETVVYRGTPISLIRINPVLHNPITKQIRVYTHLKIKVEFSGTIVRSDVRGRSEKILENIAVNGSSYLTQVRKDKKRIKSGDLDDDFDVLIVTHSDYIMAAESLSVWQKMKGYDVKIESKSSWTSAQVKTTIKNFYDENNSPEYFLIIGDHGKVPGEIKGKFATDLYYACMDGSNDYTPDMGRGRISVETKAQADIVAQKILKYERTPVENASFYKKFLSCAQFQDKEPKDGYADRRFSLTGEEMALYMKDKQGYEIERIFAAKSTVTPKNWNNKNYFFGDAIPSYLQKPGFAWDGSSTDIIKAVDQGTFLVLHRDHGNTNGWGSPKFVSTDVSKLANGDLLPVVFSINCLTGKYLNNCFAESFLRKKNGGCVGIVAAAEVSFSGPNDAFCHGLFNAVYGNPGTHMRSPKNPNPNVTSHKSIFTISDCMTSALFTMKETWKESKITWELYNYFGDPTMEMWTAKPQSITVSHKDNINIHADSFELSNLNVAEGFATLYNKMTGVIIGKVAIDGATETIAIKKTINENDEIVLTITGHNFIPHIKEIGIQSNASSFVMTSPLQNQLFDVNEDVNIVWSTEGQAVSKIKIEFSSDNGGTYTTIVNEIANSGSYNWTTPMDVGSDNCHIKMTDVSDTSVYNTGRTFFVWDICDLSGNVSGILDADVYYTGGSSGFKKTNNQGAYKCEKLYPGDYKFFALAGIYSSDTVELTLPIDTTGLNLEILFPKIKIDQNVLEVKVEAGKTKDVSLNISNDGKLDMKYSAVGVNALRGIVINEIYIPHSSFIDGCELWNRGVDVDMTGWSVVWNDDAQTSGKFDFEDGFIFKSGETIVLSDDENGANQSTFYVGVNLSWSRTDGTELSIAVLNSQGNGVDFVKSKGNTDTPPPGTKWNGDGVSLTFDRVYRKHNEDSDGITDWVGVNGEANINALNPGQSNSNASESWMTITPKEGLVGGLDTSEVKAVIDAKNLTNGTYTDTIFISHNAANIESPLKVIVNLEVKDLSYPIATDVKVVTDKNKELKVTLVGTDSDGNIEEYVIVDDPKHGSVVISDDKVTYTPQTDYVGEDEFTYIVKDDDGLESQKGKVTITINTTTEIINIDTTINTGFDFIAVPNPVDATKVGFITFVHNLKGINTARLIIRDVLGQEVSVSEMFLSGSNTFKWDLKNKNGTPVGSGTYIAILECVSYNGEVIRKIIQVGVKTD